MLITLHNQSLSLVVDTLGAQMMHIQSPAGIEYLWQGDPAYWPDRAPTLFPFIARLTNNTYRYHGKTYPMGIHGFAAADQFSPVEQDDCHVILELRDTPESRRQYPFSFCLHIGYTLLGNTIAISCQVENNSDLVMPFGIGGHPGFRVPLEPGQTFQDYYLEFSQCCQPDRIGFTPSLYLSGKDSSYPLRDERFLDLKHQLFDEDAIILKNMAREVSLKSACSSHSVTVSYPDMPYLGIWHAPRSDAPYVCIEPWSSLPARQGVVEELSCKSDMIQLAPSKYYSTTWTISLT